jgi:hypothetical protein
VCGWQPHCHLRAEWLEILVSQRLTTLWTSEACYRDSFHFLLFRRIWGSHDIGYEQHTICLVECDIRYSDSLPTFRRNVLLQSSSTCLSYSQILKTVAVRSSETQLSFYQITRHHKQDLSSHITQIIKSTPSLSTKQDYAWNSVPNSFLICLWSVLRMATACVGC